MVGIDNFLTGKEYNIPVSPSDNYKFIKANANNYEDLSAIMLAYRFDYVFHYAAVVGVKRTLENPIMVLEDIKGIQNVLHLSYWLVTSILHFSEKRFNDRSPFPSDKVPISRKSPSYQ